MSTPLTGDRKLRNRVVRVSEMTVNSAVIADYEFSNCRILGPAVLLMRDCQVVAARFDAPDLDSIFWEIPPSRQIIIGAIAVDRCMFSNCSFEGIGLAGNDELRRAIERAFSSP